MTTSYDTDFYRWTAETAALLRERRFADLDLDAVVEEIESLGRSQKHEVGSRVLRILEHLLKLDLATGQLLDYNQRGWRGAIERQREELRNLFKTSPSLRGLVDAELIRDAYEGASRIVAVEHDLQAPEECPYSAADVVGAQ